MRHGRHKYRVGSKPAHRRSLMKNLAAEVIDHGKVKTTHVKCKAVQIYLEKLITLAKEDLQAAVFKIKMLFLSFLARLLLSTPIEKVDTPEYLKWQMDELAITPR